ncbi:MAG: hypothetical protein ACTMKV_08810, partial [Sphingomonas parapaucimobilis]
EGGPFWTPIGGPFWTPIDNLYEWEREWRHVGDLKFSELDTAFLIIPENLHEAARGFFHSARVDHVGPSYECPFIDPYWGEDQIVAALCS